MNARCGDESDSSRIDRRPLALLGHVRQPADRRAATLPKLARDVEALVARGGAHVAKLGFHP